MNDDAQFTCTACHIDHDHDADTVMTSCRKCGKMHCQDCLDEFGRCVTCTDEKKPGD